MDIIALILIIHFHAKQLNQQWCNKIGKGVLESGTKRFIAKANVDEGPGPGAYTSNAPSAAIQMKNGQ